MKKKMLWAIAAVGIILIIISAVMFALHTDYEKNTLKTNLYFFNEQKTAIVPEERELNYETTRELPQIVLEELISGPSDKRNRQVISSKTKLLHLNIDTPMVTVDFSSEFLSNDASQDVLATYAVVKTLCGLSGINSVKITVEGQNVLSSDGTAIGALSDDDINIASENIEASSRDIILYFASKDMNYLVKEVHTVKITDRQPVEQYIISELIAGTRNKSLQSTLAPDTSLISAETKDGVCYVNFKSGFLDKNAGTEQKERLALYSIVNSLTELENVHQVQFLIDGKKVDKFGNIAISELFTRNTQLIAH